MNILICFYGILYGFGGRTGSARNFNHCWPNINKMLVNPLREMGHNVDLVFSSYLLEDKTVENNLIEMTQAKGIVYSDFNNSDPFTTKYASFEIIEKFDSEIVILTRSDVHWAKSIAKHPLKFDKFNFLFPEKDWWNTPYQFTCDNFYIWPSSMTNNVKLAMKETYGFPRGKPLVDTHALRVKLKQYVSENDMHMISDVEEISDVNSFYTCCRSGLPKRDCMHPEVEERYANENWSYYK